MNDADGQGEAMKVHCIIRHYRPTDKHLRLVMTLLDAYLELLLCAALSKAEPQPLILTLTFDLDP